jgi:4-diphosphocytidyl-2-C-methyl-D-erythritol kinase
LVVRAHAKINLSLRVRARREDGYHDLETVFQSLALHDTLRVASADDGFALACGAADVPTDGRNLVWRAARLVWGAGGRTGEPTGHATLTKRIPTQAGLGGGSADGAAALLAWDCLWGTALGPCRLTELAIELGADVPFFLCGGTAVGLNRGDELYPLVDLPARWVTLVIPPFGVSTPEAFRWWDQDQEASGHRRRGTTRGRARSVVTWPGGRGFPVGLPVVNDLERSVARRRPGIGVARRLLATSGAEAVAMTGSGSTVFGLFTAEEAARAAASAVRRARWRALVTRTAPRRQAAPVAP